MQSYLYLSLGELLWMRSWPLSLLSDSPSDPRAPPIPTRSSDPRVQTSAECWRREEGGYRDDITAIITHLPFLEDWGDEAEAGADIEVAAGGGAVGGSPQVLINQGAQGITKIEAEAASSPGVAPAAGQPAAGSGAAEGGTAEGGAAEANSGNSADFHRRRLSVAHPYGEDGEEGDGWENEGELSPMEEGK